MGGWIHVCGTKIRKFSRRVDIKQLWTEEINVGCAWNEKL
jgi:hypothetical protein